MEGFTPERQEAVLSPEMWETAYRRAERFEHSRFNPSDFVDIYGEDRVQQDTAKVETLKQEARNNNDADEIISKGQATIFEALVADRLQNGGWFGEAAKAYGTSEYDDWVAGVDQILEFGEGLNHLGVAVDVTFSRQLKKKFNRIYNELSQGILPTVRYFQSGPYKGQLEVPRVVVGLGYNNLEKLIRMWIDPSQQDRMRIHPFRRLFTEQVGLQLRTYYDFAIRKDQKRIADILSTVRRMYESEVKVAGVTSADWQADPVNQAIRTHMGIFDIDSRR